jgi:hypothetical protein
MKGFFKTLAKENKGYLGPKLSLQTLDAYLVRFGVAQKEEHNHEIPDSVTTEVREVPTMKSSSLADKLTRLSGCGRT